MPKVILIGASLCVLAVASAWMGHSVGKHAAASAVAEVAKQDSETEFLLEGERLQELAREGTNYDRFTEQFARTAASFQLIKEEMRRRNEKRYRAFNETLEVWDATRITWKRRLHGREFYPFNQPAWRDALISIDEPSVPEGELPPVGLLFDPDALKNTPTAHAVSLDKLIATGLRNGTRLFDSAKAQ